tara:strand:+ start:41 stop:958 length:918 start_codon:yes stop_codon:yes gene_type:complete
MFHHFHNGQHLPSQGSLSGSDFIKMINWLGEKYNLLDANTYQEKFLNQTLQDKDICLTFDDALKCQFDIAVPILERYGIKAFFFVYSSAFSEHPDLLEVYRYFRTSFYDDIDKFYDDFFSCIKKRDLKEFSNEYLKFTNLKYLSNFPFYSNNDRWFRYLRDQYLDNKDYHEIMNSLMLKKSFNITLAKKNLWMTEKDLIKISNKGHIIGLHSYSHPTKMSKLNNSAQKMEYQKNFDHLTKVVKKPITTMAHPCGDYSKETLNILNAMNIEIGFRSSMSIKKICSKLEIPREDNANVLREMRNEHI